MSPVELLGKYTVASGRIGSDGTPNRHKPIYERDSEKSERQAIAEAAEALTALWKLRTSNRP